MTARDVAQWMLETVQARRTLDQGTAAHQIRQQFGSEYVYTNANGNWGISPAVLKEFRKLSGDTVIWDRGYKEWRLRQAYDKRGRQQD